MLKRLLVSLLAAPATVRARLHKHAAERQADLAQRLDGKEVHALCKHLRNRSQTLSVEM